MLAIDGKSSWRAKLPVWIRSVLSCGETRYIRTIICPSHRPRRRETAGNPYIKSDRGCTRRSTTHGPGCRFERLRVYIVRRQVCRVGHEAGHGSGLAWTTQGLTRSLNLPPDCRKRDGMQEVVMGSLCLAVFGSSIKGRPRWRKSQGT